MSGAVTRRPARWSWRRCSPWRSAAVAVLVGGGARATGGHTRTAHPRRPGTGAAPTLGAHPAAAAVAGPTRPTEPEAPIRASRIAARSPGCSPSVAAMRSSSIWRASPSVAAPRRLALDAARAPPTRAGRGRGRRRRRSRPRVDRALEELGAGGPVGDAIIALLAAPGDAAADAGVAPCRLGHARAGGRAGAGRGRRARRAAAPLADLYREARFSRHGMSRPRRRCGPRGARRSILDRPAAGRRAD